MIILRDFEAGDLQVLLPDDSEVHPDALDYMGRHGLAGTVTERDGAIVGAGGIMPVAPHRGTTWMIARRPLTRSEWAKVIPHIRRAIARAHRLGLHRIEADVATGNLCAYNFARFLGFEVEGDRPLFFPDGGNALLMARFG